MDASYLTGLPGEIVGVSLTIKSTMTIKTIDIDLAKHVFQMHTGDEHYEKGRRQNQLLRTEDMPNGGIGHIVKIIDTYQFYKKARCYSRRAGMVKIEKNDFNLNISRYASTAQAEEEIDLAKSCGEEDWHSAGTAKPILSRVGVSLATLNFLKGFVL